MPADSKYPLIDIPNVGLWDFLFERKDRDFPDDKGDYKLTQLSSKPALISYSHFR